MNGAIICLAALILTGNAQSASKNNDPIPEATSRKGLQVQMADDALALGIRHAALNVDLAALIDPGAAPDSFTWQMDGRTFHFRRGVIEHHDRAIRPLSEAGVQVTLILLNYRSRNPAVEKIMRPASARPNPTSPIFAFNVGDAEGVAWYRAVIEFLADRYSANDLSHGRVVGYIIGNEVNSHASWYDLGDANVDAVVENYERAVRVAHAAVRMASAQARIYLSLDHQWNTQASPDPLRACTARELLDRFARRARAGGDFDWHLAFHPYPRDLRNPRTWEDKGLRSDADTKWITPRNIEVLPAYLRRPDFAVRRKAAPDHSFEQGFNTPDGTDGERSQAAGFCYTWVKLQRIEGIDAFILHRHVDHPNEDGLHLGLWTNKPAVTTPDRKKPIYEVFRACDTPDWEKAFAPYLDVIGIKSWDEIK